MRYSCSAKTKLFIGWSLIGIGLVWLTFQNVKWSNLLPPPGESFSRNDPPEVIGYCFPCRAHTLSPTARLCHTMASKQRSVSPSTAESNIAWQLCDKAFRGDIAGLKAGCRIVAGSSRTVLHMDLGVLERQPICPFLKHKHKLLN